MDNKNGEQNYQQELQLMQENPQIRKLLTQISKMRFYYSSKGYSQEEVTKLILKKMFNNDIDINWNQLNSTSEYYHLKNIYQLDNQTAYTTMQLQNQLSQFYMKQTEDIEKVSDLFLYRIEKNSRCSPSSNSDISSDFETYKMNSLIQKELMQPKLFSNQYNMVVQQTQSQQTQIQQSQKTQQLSPTQQQPQLQQQQSQQTSQLQTQQQSSSEIQQSHKLLEKRKLQAFNNNPLEKNIEKKLKLKTNGNNEVESDDQHLQNQTQSQNKKKRSSTQCKLEQSFHKDKKSIKQM